MDARDESWRDDFVVTGSGGWVIDGVSSAIATGELRRIRRGVYLRDEVAATRSPRAAHRDLAYAHELLSPGQHVFSHATAAALWRLPRIGLWPTDAHTSVRQTTGGRSEGKVVRHTVGVAEVDRIEGLMVTPLLRTVVDVARADGFLAGVLVTDHALAGVHIRAEPRVAIASSELRDAAAATSPGRGSAVAREVAAFADARAGSPGESFSRVRMRELHLPMPQLQREFHDREGQMFADFCWPTHRVIGEFDGIGKYLREKWTDGRTTAEVVIDEKRREDRLRRLGWMVVRWGWNDVMTPGRLRAILSDVGIHPM
jgi:very-short-patch-repair endonuclease